MPVRTKICGLTTQSTLDAAIAGGAAYIGFNFFQKSPRYATIPLARELAGSMPPGVCKVALSVNSDDTVLDAILNEVPMDMLQLHGSESPDRVIELRQRFGLPVMKALSIADADDLAAIDEYARVADQLLIDAKPPKNADLPGGNGLTFDWRLLQGRRWPVPWMLAGGLTSDNLAEAIRLTGATQVDLSSGVEDAPGIKSISKINQFMMEANKL